MSMAERIVKLRKEHCISQEKLAEKIYVSRQTISKWESGQAIPDVDNIKAICTYFKVSSDYLIYGIKKDNLKRNKYIIDIIILIAGITLLITSVILFFINHNNFNEVTSVIQINGYALLIILASLIIFSSIFLIYKNKKK